MYRWTLSFRILSVILRNVRLSFRLVAEVLIPPVPAHLPCFRLSSPEEEGRTPEYPRDSRRRAGRSVLPSSPQTAREPGAVLPLTRCSNRAPGVEWLGRGHPAPKFQGQRGQGQIRAATARRHPCPERPGRGYSCRAGGGAASRGSACAAWHQPARPWLQRVRDLLCNSQITIKGPRAPGACSQGLAGARCAQPRCSRKSPKWPIKCSPWPVCLQRREKLAPISPGAEWAVEAAV